MISKIKNDVPSGIVVFLVALPLCLGIALASGAPLLSGFISGIIGGIIVGLISGSHTSVSGPAAGLAAVVLASITQLGAFEIFLTAVVIAGVIQLGMGLLKAGFIANYVPSNIIKGLLSAIGIILIMKQIPHAFGYDADREGDFSFLQTDGENSFTELFQAINHISIGSLAISVLSIAILMTWDKTPLKKLRFFPASLFVVFMGIGLGILFNAVLPAFGIADKHFVSIPPVHLNDLGAVLKFPSLSAFADPKVWMVGFTIAAIASLETLLNLEAVDNLDTHKRQSPANRELVAQGVGNIFAGMLGGIPITSVIVRGSVNINSGARSKASAVIHGILLLLSVLVLTPFINLIPLASLAAILLLTGYKLTKLSLFKEIYNKGWAQFVPFVVTIVAIVFTDLLVGILIGLAVSIFFVLRSNYKNPFTIEKEQVQIGETIRIELSNQVSFLNKASIRDTLWNIPDNSKVIIDANNSDYIDKDVLELLEDFRDVVAVEKGISLNIIGLKGNYELSDHIQFINVLDKKRQSSLTAASILEILKSGNERFVKGKWTEKYFRHQVNATSFGQYPMAVVVSCIDSRSTPELVFDLGIGDIISVRIAGNIISKEIIGSIELACQEIGTKLIVVMGHSNCGAVASAIGKLKDHSISSITEKIEPAVYSYLHPGSTEKLSKDTISRITCLNAQNSASEILNSSELIRDMVADERVSVISAYYETETGKVLFEDDSMFLGTVAEKKQQLVF